MSPEAADLEKYFGQTGYGRGDVVSLGSGIRNSVLCEFVRCERRRFRKVAPLRGSGDNCRVPDHVDCVTWDKQEEVSFGNCIRPVACSCCGLRCFNVPVVLGLLVQLVWGAVIIATDVEVAEAVQWSTAWGEMNLPSRSVLTADRLLSGAGSGSFPGAEGEREFVEG